MNKIPIIEIHQPGIYAIHNKRNGKYYIGSTNDLRNRTRTHRQNLYSGLVNTRMLPDLFAGGKQKDFEFIALEVFENGEITEAYLRKREEYFIKKYRADSEGYNNPSHSPCPHPTKGTRPVFGHPAENEKKQKWCFGRIAVNLPKGSKERIKELTGKSCNAYISELVLADLERLESLSKPQEEEEPAFMRE